MRIATLGFLVNDGQVLLGKKKAGAKVGSGKLNGGGGKLEPEDNGSVEACLIREMEEEFGVTSKEYSEVAVVHFYAGGELQFEVHVYLITSWEGEIRTTESMSNLSWYDCANLPLDDMHDGDRHWITNVFSGEPFTAEIFYERPGERFIDKKITPGALR